MPEGALRKFAKAMVDFGKALSVGVSDMEKSMAEVGDALAAAAPTVAQVATAIQDAYDLSSDAGRRMRGLPVAGDWPRLDALLQWLEPYPIEKVVSDMDVARDRLRVALWMEMPSDTIPPTRLVGRNADYVFELPGEWRRMPITYQGWEEDEMLPTFHAAQFDQWWQDTVRSSGTSEDPEQSREREQTSYWSFEVDLRDGRDEHYAP